MSHEQSGTYAATQLQGSRLAEAGLLSLGKPEPPLALAADCGRITGAARWIRHFHTRASDLSGHHEVQLGFIPIRRYFQAQWLKENLELLSRGKWFNKQIAGGS